MQCLLWRLTSRKPYSPRGCASNSGTGTDHDPERRTLRFGDDVRKRSGSDAEDRRGSTAGIHVRVPEAQMPGSPAQDGPAVGFALADLHSGAQLLHLPLVPAAKGLQCSPRTFSPSAGRVSC